MKRGIAWLMALVLFFAAAPAQAFEGLLFPSNSLPMMGETDALGDGVVIAIIDTGILPEHEVFRDYGLMESPKLREEDIRAFAAEGGTKGRYLSQKIPFAYDYSLGTDTVRSADGHGTHVAALAAGYAEYEDGTVKFRGVAPAAQLLIMKVFPDATGRTELAPLLAALNDAEKLGADIISMSLGVNSGFLGGEPMEQLYGDTVRHLREKGILVCSAGGNSAAIPLFKGEGVALPGCGYTDYGSVNVPGIYEGSLSVAAAEADMRMASGYLQHGEQRIYYRDAVPGAVGSVPPMLSLAGSTRKLIAVKGEGRQEDYRGLRLNGGIALVRRGGISFEEKAKCAAAAGAAACIVYHTDDAEIQALVPDSPIPCALVSKEDGAYLLGMAAAGQRITVSGGRYIVENGSHTQMMWQSAWGCGPELRLRPTVTAPGGDVLSAWIGGPEEYLQLSGTSMATPNVAGGLAVLLEILRERGIHDKKEAADLAEAMLLSTAKLLRAPDGVPLSPRRQGAGLVDLKAAAAAEILVAEPLLELGDSRDGRFTAALTLKNTGSGDRTEKISGVVLTDDFRCVDGVYYSTMTPRDITDHVKLTVPETVTIPAGETVTIPVTLTVDRKLRKDMETVYSNGFFVEGYIQVGEAHSTFMGFSGDWTKAPIIEDTDFRDILTYRGGEGEKPYVELAPKAVCRTNEGRQLAGCPYLGEGKAAVPFAEQRCAIGGVGSNALRNTGHLASSDLYLLRNARRIVITVENSRTGQILKVSDLPWVRRSDNHIITMEPAPSVSFYVDGTDNRGQPLPDGTELTVNVYGWLESDRSMEQAYERQHPDPARPMSYNWLRGRAYATAVQWSFDLTVDSSAPVASAVRTESGVTVAVGDNQFLDYASVFTEDGRLVAEKCWGDTSPGKSHTVTLDSELLKGEDSLQLRVSDYAGNVSGFTVRWDTLGDTPVELVPSGVALLDDVTADAWYGEALDHLWRANILKEDETGLFHPEDCATRGQTLMCLYDMMGGEANFEKKLPFQDVQWNNPAYDAVLWAWQTGIAQGYTDTVFAPYAPVKREQLAVMLRRCAPEISNDSIGSLDIYPDGDTVSKWAENDVAWALEQGILLPRENGCVDAGDQTTRAELAWALYRLYECCYTCT